MVIVKHGLGIFADARIDNLGKTFYKGAPEKLLAAAGKYLDAEGTVQPLDQAALNKNDGKIHHAFYLAVFA